MTPASQTSIERFLLNRGKAWILPSLSGPSGYRIQLHVGTLFTAAGALMFLGGLATHGSASTGIMIGSIGPLTGGITNLLVGFTFRKKAMAATSETVLSPEAAKFLADLAKPSNRISRIPGEGRPDRSRHRGRGEGISSPNQITKSSRDLLPPDLFDLVEGACYQYNRIFGLIKSAPEKSPISKISQSCLLAADEAMSEILHQAAMISKFPESGATAINLVNLRIEALHELADRLEAVQSRIPSITDRLSTTSTMESVLEELRLTEMARIELTEQSVVDRL